MVLLKNIVIILSVWVALSVTLDDSIALYCNTNADLYSMQSESSTLSHTHFLVHDHFLQKSGHQAPIPENQIPDAYRISNENWATNSYHNAVWQPPKSGMLTLIV